MAQIHALLMVSTSALSMEEIMEEIHISRGNTSMNLRALMDWGIVFKEYKPGERKEYFSAEGNIDELARKIAKERSKREVKPTLRVLRDINTIDAKDSEEAAYFKSKTEELYNFVSRADNMLEKITEQKENWITKTIIKLMTQGHFKKFRHEHRFYESTNTTTIMHDYLSYDVPYGWVGQFFDIFFVKKHLVNFLKIRNKNLKKVLESK